MTNTHSFGYRSFVNHVRSAMRKVGFASILQLSVSAVVLTRIDNAAVRMNDPTDVKTRLQRFKKWWDFRETYRSTSTATKFSAFDVRRRSMQRKCTGTLLTSQICGSHVMFDYMTHERFHGFAWDHAKQAMGVA